MDANSNIPRNPYGFLGSRPATNPVINSGRRTGPVSSHFTDGNADVETTVQRIPQFDMPAKSFEVACDRPQIVEEFLKKIQTEVSQPAWPPAMILQFGPNTRVDFSDSTNGMPRSGFVVQSHMTPPTIYRTTPPRPNAKISQALNDIAEATESLKEVTRPSVPVAIDNREAARRYPNAIVSMEPYNKERSTPILDCKTAKHKYRGAFVSWSDPI